MSSVLIKRTNKQEGQHVTIYGTMYYVLWYYLLGLPAWLMSFARNILASLFTHRISNEEKKFLNNDTNGLVINFFFFCSDKENK